MNCRQYRRALSDWATDRLNPAERDAMTAHSALCRDCTRCKQEEETLLAAWRKIPDAAAPDVSLRLRSRINNATPAARPLRIGYAGYLAAASAAVCAIGGVYAVIYLSPLQKNEGIARKDEAKSVALLPAAPLPLAEMLMEVRWRSSDERRISDEPPSYNTETRALLLPSQKENAR